MRQKRRTRDASDNGLPSKRRRIQQNDPPFQWNPPSLKQRRETRVQYAALAQYTQDNRVHIVDPMSKEFSNTLAKQDALNEDVGHIQEMHLDVLQSLTMATVLKDKVRKLGSQSFTISPVDYIRCIANKFGQTNENNEQQMNEPHKVNWSEIGAKYASEFLTIPPIQFMNGSFQQSAQNTESPKRTVRRKPAKFKANGPVIKPHMVVKKKDCDNTETKSRVLNLTKCLKEKCVKQDGVNPFEFLINPDSYSETIENIFDLSFVVKEGRGQMVINNLTKQPVLSYIPSRERKRRYNENGEVDHRQCIVKFNPRTFCNLIEIYNIKESQIQRDEVLDEESETETEQESEVQTRRVNNRRCRNRVSVRYNDKEEAD